MALHLLEEPCLSLSGGVAGNSCGFCDEPEYSRKEKGVGVPTPDFLNTPGEGRGNIHQVSSKDGVYKDM